MSASFDPAAETARYLATLPPEVHAKATAYTQGGHWLLLGGFIVSAIVAWLIIRSNLLARTRDGVEKGRSRPWLVALCVIPLAVLLDSVLSLPWAVYSDWWRETRYGLTSQSLGGWLGEWAMGLVIGVVMTSLLMLAVYWLLRRAPKTWWLWASGVTGVFIILAMVVAPVFIRPLFNQYTPAPHGELRTSIEDMARANGVPSDKIFVYNGSKQSNRYTANVNGLFGSAQINMSDTMFKAGADLSEVRAVVGHEMGHYAHQHALWFVGVMTILAIVGFWLLDRLFPVAARLLGAKNVRGIADPAGLPVFMLVMSFLFLLATPITNTMVRTAESDADNYSLKVAADPDGLAKALIQTVEYRAATPGAVEEFIFYDHPSVSRRIRNAMDWKAAHPPRGDEPMDPDNAPPAGD